MFFTWKFGESQKAGLLKEGTPLAALFPSPTISVQKGMLVIFFPMCSLDLLGVFRRCSSLENLRDGGAWWAAIYGVTHSRTRLK